ncbi:MAG: hypothetical protein ABJA67_12710, partial [Chthonomonadales bacterium]
MPEEFARRIQMQKWSQAEKVIADARRFVDAGPADVRLTKAVVALSDAQAHVADYIDEMGIPDQWKLEP